MWRTAAGACVACFAVGVVVGWAGGRAHQRTSDSWARLRAHRKMTPLMWRAARQTTGEEASTIVLAVLVVAAAITAAWILF
jgi:hypothetical protein